MTHTQDTNAFAAAFDAADEHENTGLRQNMFTGFITQGLQDLIGG